MEMEWRCLHACLQTLEVFLNDMRYINPRFTYLLLLTCVCYCCRQLPGAGSVFRRHSSSDRQSRMLSSSHYILLIRVSECVDLCSALSSRTPNALDTLVTREQVDA